MSLTLVSTLTGMACGGHLVTNALESVQSKDRLKLQRTCAKNWH